MSGTPFRGHPTSPLAIGRSPRQQLFMTHLPCLTARGRGEPTLISPVTVCEPLLFISIFARPAQSLHCIPFIVLSGFHQVS